MHGLCTKFYGVSYNQMLFNVIIYLIIKLAHNLWPKFRGASYIQISFKYNNLLINEIRSQPVTQIPSEIISTIYLTLNLKRLFLTPKDLIIEILDMRKSFILSIKKIFPQVVGDLKITDNIITTAKKSKAFKYFHKLWNNCY